MKVSKISNVAQRERGQIDNWKRDVDSDLRNLFVLAQGRIRMGTGTDGDIGENIEGQFQLFTSSATPDAENTIAHDLGATPIGFIILHQDKAGSLYQGPTTGTNWTSSNVYLKCDVASVTFLIFLLK